MPNEHESALSIVELEKIYTTIEKACGGNLEAYRIEFHQRDYLNIRDALNLHGCYLGKNNVIIKKKSLSEVIHAANMMSRRAGK